MTEKSKYRDWKVWQDAVDVGVEVMNIEYPLPELISIQLRQTAISISCKIAEGATGDKLGYRAARKAAARLETYLVIIHKLNPVEANEHEELLTTLESIQAQLGALMRTVNY